MVAGTAEGLGSGFGSGTTGGCDVPGVLVLAGAGEGFGAGFGGETTGGAGFFGAGLVQISLPRELITIVP